MRIDGLKETARFYLADGGLETTMVFEKGFDLPCFSAAVLLDTAAGRQALRDYFEHYITIARESGRGFVLDAPTWRAGAAWAGPLGQDLARTLATNARAVDFVQEVRSRHETEALPIVLNGLVGPAGDAYAPDRHLKAEEAVLLHMPQVRALARAGVDMITAMTLTHAAEAAGIATAASEIACPIAIAFTLETDGRLPSGQSLGEAIAEVDSQSDAAPLYYMINCAHPDHFREVLEGGQSWIRRIGGIRSNASRLSHAELDAAESLDDGDPVELGRLNGDLLRLLPNLRVLGGCCGTDHRHVGCMAMQGAWQSAA